MDKDHVVVMVEPANAAEKLKVTEQINEVFGPMTEAEATDFTDRMVPLYKGKRQWLIIPLSDPTVVNMLEAKRN